MADLFKFSKSNQDKGDQYKQITRTLYEKNVELLKEKRKIEVILNNISEGIINTDEFFNIVLLNGAAKYILFSDSTYDEINTVGKNFFDVVTFKSKQDKPITKEEILQTKLFYKDNYLILPSAFKPKFVYFHISEFSVEENKKNYIISIRDVTSEKELERTKNDFVSVTSHELRTPMTIIKSYLWMLANKKGGTLNEKQTEYLNKAMKGADRMLNLINDTLNISRLEQGRIEFNIEKIEYVEFLNDISQEFIMKTDEKKLNFNLNIAPKVKYVSADKNKLREIITNFVGNSVKFTQTGGITVNVEIVNNTHIKTSVTDTGKGIAKIDIPKLFHKFSRLDNSYQTVAESGGTGLGLFIVKSLVEAMGGAIGVESEGEGKGSTFWYTLPIQATSATIVRNITTADQESEYANTNKTANTQAE